MPNIFRWIFYGCVGRTMMTLCALLTIFLIVETFDKVRYLGHGLTTGLMVEYLMLKMPFMVSEFMPVILLLAVSIHVTDMSHHQELVAMRAAGLGMNKLITPLLCVALLAALLSFAIGEWMTPATNIRLDHIERVAIRHQADTRHGIQWLKDGHRFFRLEPLGINHFKLLMLETDATDHWLMRLDAASATYTKGAWHLRNVDISKPAIAKDIHIEHRDSMVLRTTIGPDTAAPPRPRHMHFFELKQYASDLHQAGLASARFEFALQKKIASPVACLIMVVLAVGLCIHSGGRMAAVSRGMISAISVGLLFYVFSHASGLLSAGERLPAGFAAWLPDLLFGGSACFLLLHREGH